MSTLQRLKAYFGMVPAEELDDYDPDYEAGRRADFDRAGYDYDPYASDYEARHGAGYDDEEEEADDVRGRSYASEPTGPRRPRRAAREDCDGRARYGRADDGSVEPEVGRIRAAHRPRWPADAAAVCGALAVDTTAALGEPAQEPVREFLPRSHPPFAEDGHLRPCIVTLHPRTYNEARTIGERYREGMPVIMNLTGMDDADAKRLVDFAAGLAFALRGSIDKVTTKVFLLSPTGVAVSAEVERPIGGDGSPRRS